jgi:hypothetical protein
MLTDMQARINTEAEYQRGNVWSEAQQRLLIDSLFRGYDLPKLYFRKLADGGEFLYEVVDGKQRLTAMWRFLNNEFRLPRASHFDQLGQLGRKSWSELSPPAQDRLQFAMVTVSVIEEATDEEVAELFLRLQKGEPLRAAEKRNAILGPVRDFVAGTLATHPVFPHLGIPDRRFTWHELAAIALILTVKDGPTTLKGADLSDLYEDANFAPSGAAATRTQELLTALDRVAQVQPGTITTRWGFVDLYLCLARLIANERPWEPEQVMLFFVDFESERKDASTLLSELRDELSELDPTEIDAHETTVELPDVRPDMFAYVQAFSREGATESSVRARFEVMFKRLSARLDELSA